MCGRESVGERGKESVGELECGRVCGRARA